MTQLCPPDAGRWGSCGNFSSSLHGPKPSCLEHSSPLTTGNKSEIYTTLLQSVLQQSGLRVHKQRGALRDIEVTEKDLAPTQELYFSIFSSLAFRKEPVSALILTVTTAAATFKATQTPASQAGTQEDTSRDRVLALELAAA